MSNETKAPRPGLEFWGKLNALPRFAFLLSPSGNAVQKFEDKALGNWIDVHEAQTIVDQAQERISELRDELGAVKGEYDRAVNKVDALQLRLNAAEQRIDELVSAVRSINRGRRHEVFVPGDDEPQYRQRKEWVDWALSLCDEVSASDRCHEIPGTSGMRLNMLANQGE